MTKIRSLCSLFWAMFKTGLFTFGGGNAMIGLMENEFVNRKHWLGSEEFMDLVAIAESTPGPIAINCATYIGYKKEKVLGSIVSTLGVVLPSFIIIYVISLFFNRFLSISWVASAFKGIQICAVFLILSAGVRMLKKLKKNVFNIVIMTATVVSMIVLSLFAVDFSSVFYILISGLIGLLLYGIGCARKNKKKENEVQK